MLLDLVPETIHQQDLFLEPRQDSAVRKEKLMKSLDTINAKFGRSTLKFCAEGFNHDWALRSNFRSSRFTTRLGEVMKVKCK